jgi:hypothetical protein
VVAAVEKERSLPALGNFITGWDFSRFAFLVNSLKADIFPDKDAAEALSQCRVARNEDAHPDHDPRGQLHDDSRLAALIHRARKCLPRINRLEPSSIEWKDIYKRLSELEEIIYKRLNEDVPTCLHLTDA